MIMTDPYLTVTELERQLTLQRIDCPLTIRPGIYRAWADDHWIDLHAVEPRISTGAAPIRAVQLRASTGVALELLRLEVALRARGGPLQMETLDQRAFVVTFKDVRATLYAYGAFQRQCDEPEIQYRICLADREIRGTAFDREREGRRGLALNDLDLGDEEQLIRAFMSNQSITVERAEVGGSVEALR